MTPGSQLTLAEWNADNVLRYSILRPPLFVTSVLGLPVCLFRVTRKWIAANSERLRPPPRLFRHWGWAAVAWMLLLLLIPVLVEASTRFGAPPVLVVVPLLLAFALLWLRSFTHPKVSPFDQRYHSR